MSSPTILYAVILASCVWIIGPFIYRFIKFRGLAPVAFGASIERTVGVIDLGGGTQVKVYKLQGNTPDKAIGLEFTRAALPVYWFAMSVPEAQKLALLVESTVVDSEA